MPQAMAKNKNRNTRNLLRALNSIILPIIAKLAENESRQVGTMFEA
jgi:hypothetical protein